MKKILALCLTVVLCLFCLASCTLFAKHSITYADKETERLLHDGYAPKRANPGDTVVLRAGPIMDADLYFYANGVVIENTHNDSDYWEYTFIMPDEDVVITHKMSDGFIQVKCDCHIDQDANGACDNCGHKHTITYVSAGESGHFENYTCGCPHDHGAVPHYDENGDYICDACGYVMPEHKHTYEYNHDDIGHGWSYTCGCMTPPNFAQHFDGNGDGKCDDCGYCISSSGEYSVTMNDEDWLYEPITATYNEGDTVKVKITMAYDLGYIFLVNGEEIATCNDVDGLYWEFSFTMPASDAVIDFKTYDGFLPDANYDILYRAYWLKYPKSDYVSIRNYYGELENGALVAIIDSGFYTEAEWHEVINEVAFHYNDGNRITVYYEGEFYTLTDAYNEGIITDDQLFEIREKHNRFNAIFT